MRNVDAQIWEIVYEPATDSIKVLNKGQRLQCEWGATRPPRGRRAGSLRRATPPPAAFCRRPPAHGHAPLLSNPPTADDTEVSPKDNRISIVLESATPLAGGAPSFAQLQAVLKASGPGPEVGGQGL